MSDSIPTELQVFSQLLEQMSVSAGDASPTIRCIAMELSRLTPNQSKDGARAIFDLIRSVEAVVDTHLIGSANQRSADRIKARMDDLFSVENLHLRYDSFQNANRHQILALHDMLTILDGATFDGPALSESKGKISEELERLIQDTMGTGEISTDLKDLVRAQLRLIQTTLDRFEIDGVTPFRQSIYCAVGVLTIELDRLPKAQQGAIRSIIDDIVRVKDMAETVGGALRLTGPIITGLLAAPPT